MPIYKYKDTETGKIWEEFQTLAGREKFLKENPHVKQQVNWSCGSIDGILANDKQMADVAKQHYNFSGNKGIQSSLKEYLPDGAREF